MTVNKIQNSQHYYLSGKQTWSGQQLLVIAETRPTEAETGSQRSCWRRWGWLNSCATTSTHSNYLDSGTTGEIELENGRSLEETAPIPLQKSMEEETYYIDQENYQRESQDSDVVPLWARWAELTYQQVDKYKPDLVPRTCPQGVAGGKAREGSYFNSLYLSSTEIAVTAPYRYINSTQRFNSNGEE